MAWCNFWYTKIGKHILMKQILQIETDTSQIASDFFLIFFSVVVFAQNLI